MSGHRPLIVAVESLLAVEGPATDGPAVLTRSEGILLGCSGIFATSFFASSQASKFYQGYISERVPFSEERPYVPSYTIRDGYAPC